LPSEKERLASSDKNTEKSGLNVLSTETGMTSRGEDFDRDWIY